MALKRIKNPSSWLLEDHRLPNWVEALIVTSLAVKDRLVSDLSSDDRFVLDLIADIVLDRKCADDDYISDSCIKIAVVWASPRLSSSYLRQLIFGLNLRDDIQSAVLDYFDDSKPGNSHKNCRDIRARLLADFRDTRIVDEVKPQIQKVAYYVLRLESKWMGSDTAASKIAEKQLEILADECRRPVCTTGQTLFYATLLPQLVIGIGEDLSRAPVTFAPYAMDFLSKGLKKIGIPIRYSTDVHHLYLMVNQLLVSRGEDALPPDLYIPAYKDMVLSRFQEKILFSDQVHFLGLCITQLAGLFSGEASGSPMMPILNSFCAYHEIDEAKAVPPKNTMNHWLDYFSGCMDASDEHKRERLDRAFELVFSVLSVPMTKEDLKAWESTISGTPFLCRMAKAGLYDHFFRVWRTLTLARKNELLSGRDEYGLHLFDYVVLGGSIPLLTMLSTDTIAQGYFSEFYSALTIPERARHFQLGAESGNADMVRYLINAWVPLSDTDSIVDTVLSPDDAGFNMVMRAAMSGDLAALKEVMLPLDALPEAELKEKLDVRNHFGQTALILAAHKNHKAVCEYLLLKGDNLFSSTSGSLDTRGFNAVDIALMENHTDVLEVFLCEKPHHIFWGYKAFDLIWSVFDSLDQATKRLVLKKIPADELFVISDLIDRGAEQSARECFDLLSDPDGAFSDHQMVILMTCPSLHLFTLVKNWGFQRWKQYWTEHRLPPPISDYRIRVDEGYIRGLFRLYEEVLNPFLDPIIPTLLIQERGLDGSGMPSLFPQENSLSDLIGSIFSIQNRNPTQIILGANAGRRRFYTEDSAESLLDSAFPIQNIYRSIDRDSPFNRLDLFSVPGQRSFAKRFLERAYDCSNAQCESVFLSLPKRLQTMLLLEEMAFLLDTMPDCSALWKNQLLARIHFKPDCAPTELERALCKRIPFFPPQVIKWVFKSLPKVHQLVFFEQVSQTDLVTILNTVPSDKGLPPAWISKRCYRHFLGVLKRDNSLVRSLDLRNQVYFIGMMAPAIWVPNFLDELSLNATKQFFSELRQRDEKRFLAVFSAFKNWDQSRWFKAMFPSEQAFILNQTAWDRCHTLLRGFSYSEFQDLLSSDSLDSDIRELMFLSQTEARQCEFFLNFPAKAQADLLSRDKSRSLMRWINKLSVSSYAALVNEPSLSVEDRGAVIRQYDKYDPKALFGLYRFDVQVAILNEADPEFIYEYLSGKWGGFYAAASYLYDIPGFKDDLFKSILNAHVSDTDLELDDPEFIYSKRDFRTLVVKSEAKGDGPFSKSFVCHPGLKPELVRYVFKRTTLRVKLFQSLPLDRKVSVLNAIDIDGSGDNLFADDSCWAGDSAVYLFNSSPSAVQQAILSHEDLEVSRARIFFLGHPDEERESVFLGLNTYGQVRLLMAFNLPPEPVAEPESRRLFVNKKPSPGPYLEQMLPLFNSISLVTRQAILSHDNLDDAHLLFLFSQCPEDEKEDLFLGLTPGVQARILIASDPAVQRSYFLSLSMAPKRALFNTHFVLWKACFLGLDRVDQLSHFETLSESEKWNFLNDPDPTDIQMVCFLMCDDPVKQSLFKSFSVPIQLAYLNQIEDVDLSRKLIGILPDRRVHLLVNHPLLSLRVLVAWGLAQLKEMNVDTFFHGLSPELSAKIIFHPHFTSRDKVLGLLSKQVRNPILSYVGPCIRFE